MRPYYEHAGITIYHGDCREVLPIVGRVDAALTDPPYGIGLTKKTSDYRDSAHFDGGESLKASTLYEDNPEHVRALVREVLPVLRSMASRVVVFPGPANMWAYEEPDGIGCVFTPNGAGRSRWGFQCMHPILYYGSDPKLADGQGSHPNSFRTEQPNTERYDHPCPKPLAWMKWVVGRATRPGETVLDPFMGTGTTLRAAKDMGRKAIGIDLEERYCEIAATRLSQEVLDLGDVA